MSGYFLCICLFPSSFRNLNLTINNTLLLDNCHCFSYLTPVCSDLMFHILFFNWLDIWFSLIDHQKSPIIPVRQFKFELQFLSQFECDMLHQKNRIQRFTFSHADFIGVWRSSLPTFKAPDLSVRQNISYRLKGRLQYTVARGTHRPTSSLLAD